MTRLLEVKGRRPETVNGAWKAPIPIKRRGWMPRLSDQIKNKVAPKEAVSHDQIKKRGRTAKCLDPHPE
jgi:hypothetical protein